MRRAMVLSIIDQALLSAFNLGLSVLLIRLTSPVEFGLFSYVMAVLLIMGSVHNALVATPIGVSIPGRPVSTKQRVLAVLVKIDHLLRAALVIIAAALFLAASDRASFVIIALLVCFFWLWRETHRSIAFAEGNAALALNIDAIAVISSVVGIALLWRLVQPIEAALGGIAAGHAIAVLLQKSAASSEAIKPAIKGYAEFWKDARWSLFGAVTTEAQFRGYVFAVQSFRGADALGHVQAGRTLMGPLPLLASAWSRVARPAMTQALVEGRNNDALTTLWRGVAFVLGLSAVYLLALYAAWPMIEAHLYQGRYPDIGIITLAWGATILLSIGHICLGAYVQAARLFRPLAFVSVVAAICSGCCLMVLAANVPVVYAVLAVAAGEVIALVMSVALILRHCRPAVTPELERAQ